MLKINRKVEYALIALKHIKMNSDILVSAREICDIYKTPFDTTAKVMQIMNTNEILSSVQGIKGGYQLAKPLNEISYYTLVELIEGKESAKDCVQKSCNMLDSCNIVTPLLRLNHHINTFLKNLTLDELLAETAPAIQKREYYYEPRT